MKKIYYIIDIKKRIKNKVSFDKYIKKNSKILSLTPYSCFLLEQNKFAYSTYHSICSVKEFSCKVFNEYEKLENELNVYPEYTTLFRHLAIVKTYEIYLMILFQFIKEKKQQGYFIVYITDTNKIEDISKFSLMSNDSSGLHYCEDINKTIFINKKDNLFYRIKSINRQILTLFYKLNLLGILIKRITQKQKYILNYEHKYFQNFWKNLSPVNIKTFISKEKYKVFRKNIEETFINNKYPLSFLYKDVLNKMDIAIAQSNFQETLSLKPFTYISTCKDSIRNILYKKNKIPRIFWQHGSYIHEHIFLKSNEISIADINFVSNEYTKKIFLKSDAVSVYTVGSIGFNYKLRDKKCVYDYVYIINNMHYSWSGTYIDAKSASYHMDAYNLYKRHKEIIDLFGIKLQDKKLCIKIQPGIFTGNMLYIPFLELSKKFNNVTIEFIKPLKKLFEESKYIISDYFSSEFINRNLHYNRDIILFQNSPTPLPEETLDDMNKMFILVDTVDDLEDKIKNIEKITKNRKRYDDIIEYYSSKKCDTKKIVAEILEKELNGR